MSGSLAGLDLLEVARHLVQPADPVLNGRVRVEQSVEASAPRAFLLAERLRYVQVRGSLVGPAELVVVSPDLTQGVGEPGRIACEQGPVGIGEILPAAADG